MKVNGGKVRITLVANKEYLNVDFSTAWFRKRVKGMKIVEPILKDNRVILVFKKELPLVTPAHAKGSRIYSR